jgi:hypothetical protein
MSWASHGTIKSQRKKISLIEKRTMSTEMPPLDSLFTNPSRQRSSKALTTDLVDQVYFSSFPATDASIAISTLSMNSRNIDGIRQSGALGVVIEMLRRVDFDCPLDDVHITDLIRSISILTQNSDAQSRLLSNPHAVGCILRLCLKTSGPAQDQIFNVLDRLCRSQGSLEVLLSNQIFHYLLSFELLCRSSTYLTVRHNSASLINRITSLQPKEFPVERFEEILLMNGHRQVDGFIEMQLLVAFYAHVSYLAAEKLPLTGCSSLLLHLINEIKDEKFEDLDHVR